jgi:hypothetical protein
MRGGCFFMEWKGLEKWSPRIWPFTVGVGLVILIAALYNLYLTIKASRPELVSTDAKLYVNPAGNPPEWVSITWGNIGKKPAFRGTAILFTVSDDGNRHEKFGEREITTATNSTTLIPTFGYGSANIGVNMQKFLGVFLACVKYIDEDYSYKQSFIFQKSTESADKTLIHLDEIPS